jgi:hypothetical protein
MVLDLSTERVQSCLTCARLAAKVMARCPYDGEYCPGVIAQRVSYHWRNGRKQKKLRYAIDYDDGKTAIVEARDVKDPAEKNRKRASGRVSKIVAAPAESELKKERWAQGYGPTDQHPRKFETAAERREREAHQHAAAKDFDRKLTEQYGFSDVFDDSR